MKFLTSEYEIVSHSSENMDLVDQVLATINDNENISQFKNFIYDDEKSDSIQIGTSKIITIDLSN